MLHTQFCPSRSRMYSPVQQLLDMLLTVGVSGCLYGPCCTGHAGVLDGYGCRDQGLVIGTGHGCNASQNEGACSSSAS